jgi:hypothetical protein
MIAWIGCPFMIEPDGGPKLDAGPFSPRTEPSSGGRIFVPRLICDLAQRGDVPIAEARENQNAVIAIWHRDLCVVDGEAIIILKLRGGPLNDALRLHIAIVGAVKDEDRAAKWFGDENLVPSWIGPVLPHLETANGAAHLGLVALYTPLCMHGAIAAALVGSEAWMDHAV